MTPGHYRGFLFLRPELIMPFRMEWSSPSVTPIIPFMSWAKRTATGSPERVNTRRFSSADWQNGKNIDTSISQNHFHMKHSHARTFEHTCFRIVPVKLSQRHVFFNYPEVRVLHIAEAITVVMVTDAWSAVIETLLARAVITRAQLITFRST